MKKGLLIILGILAFCAFADATDCVVRQRVTYQQHYATPAYVAPYAAPAAIYAPVAVVPIYSHGYGQTNEELAGKIERLEFELEKQKFQHERREFQQFQKLQQKFDAKPEQLPSPAKQMPKADAKGEHPALAILSKNCLSCHNATKKEGKLDLTVALSDKQLRKVATMTYRGDMPPGKALPDDAVGQIQDWVDGHK
jgi:hypothetical protein